MQSAAETVENASILSDGSAQDGHRLWIGNIDPKITEWVFSSIETLGWALTALPSRQTCGPAWMMD